MDIRIAYETMLGLAAEMTLDEALRKFRKEQLYGEIDHALEEGDSESFLRLTEELKAILH